MPNDFMGFEIRVGDEVIFSHKEYANLVYGVITKVNKKMVTIQPRNGEECYRNHGNVFVVVGDRKIGLECK